MMLVNIKNNSKIIKMFRVIVIVKGASNLLERC